MTLNWLLTLVALLSSVVGLYHALRSDSRSRGRFLVPVLILIAFAVGFFHNPGWAGFYGGTVWFFGVMLPSLLLRWTSSLLAKRRYRLAFITSWIAGWLQPFGGTTGQIDLIRALDWFSTGKSDQAMKLLEELGTENSSIGRAAIVLKVRHSGDWESFLETLEDPNLRGSFLSDSLGIDLYLQALGETGHVEEMFTAFEHLVEHRRRPSTATFINLARLKVSAFAGQPELAELISHGPLSHLSQETIEFWLATSLQASGQSEEAEQAFHKLAESSDAQIAQMAQQRLVHPVAQTAQLPKFASRLLTEFAETVEHEARYALFGQLNRRRTWMINSIAIVLIIVFIAEMLYGDVFALVFLKDTPLTILDKIRIMLRNAERPETHIACGALVLPQSLVPGEWWRVIFAAFLHGNLIHLLANLIGLLFLGRRLERAWGALTTGICYLICAILSIGLMPFFIPVGPEERIFLVGASGGVMGLMGCLIAYMGVGTRVRRNAFVAGDFKWASFMAIAQFTIDRFTPNVSSACHFAGLLTGLCLGTLVGLMQEWSLKRQAATKKTASVSTRS